MSKLNEKHFDDKLKVQFDKIVNKELQKIIGSRPVPNHIMYDGSTNIGKKQLSDHINLKVQIQFNWNDNKNENENINNSETETKQILPKINNLKQSTEYIQQKPLLSLEHQKRYGKFSMRYLQKTNPFGDSIDKEIENFESSSGKYGKFYMKSNANQNQLREFDQKYCVIPVEQPILKYHRFIIRFPFAQQVSIQSTTSVKKCFKEASVEMATNAINPFHQWFIKLDGKSIKTSQRNSLAVPSPQLAVCIATEFNHQKDYLNFPSMPLMMLARNAIDLDYDATNREMIKCFIITTLENDPILKRNENQVVLQQIQQKEFNEQLKLFNQRFGMTLTTNDDIENKELKFQDKVKIESLINGLNNWQLVSLNSKIENLKSCILAIHLTYGLLDIKTAINLSKLIQGNQQENEEDNIESNLKASQMFSQLIYSQSIIY